MFRLSYVLDCDPKPHLNHIRENGYIDYYSRDLVTADVCIEVGENKICRHHVSLIFAYLELYYLLVERLSAMGEVTVAIDSDPVCYCQKTESICDFYNIKPEEGLSVIDNYLGRAPYEEITRALSAMRESILEDLGDIHTVIESYLELR